jgi:hypothetical protein
MLFGGQTFGWTRTEALHTFPTRIITKEGGGIFPLLFACVTIGIDAENKSGKGKSCSGVCL